ncbi:MAG: HD domain-containing protein [Desulfobacula sp.]|uniref:HD domain-containing protein n=1 Tax=Desulfobacula sp. TaxID=2593537 RepID=UPI0025C02541|nr:HD domain-containing protein [Desulfobacula sp.]MCD4720544.1 HD domain-containing protein [Desulfobacula sp.]
MGIEMNWSKFIQRVFQSAEPYLKKRGDILHTQVAHQYTLVLMKQEGGDKKIVEPAIILHDVGWSSLDPIQIQAAYGVRSGGKEADRLNRIHEREGAVIALQILQSLKYAPQFTDEIISIIQRHDSGITARSIEEQVVKDADKLWRFSKIGFWEEIERQELEPAELYQYLLTRYPEWFFTDTALIIAGKEIKKRGVETM